MNKLIVYIDDIPVYVPLQTTVIQACERVGLSVPRFCYHNLLGIAGNCRMCLIEVERSPKPQVACGLPVLNKIRVYTKTPLVKKARESVLEFLLLNHPLDCPICDQGGECDLQNQSIKYGSERGRFFQSKRGVEDKGFGPVVKTVITRCIHCTRCVRFAIDIAGVGDLGTTIRGSLIEIGTYTPKVFISEVSGNVIDLCPVGALTSKPHAFKTRPWEIKTVKSIDTTDCLGSHIVIESKKSKPTRVAPRPCIEINEEWITDKARFVYEGFIRNRFTISYYLKKNTFHRFSSFKKVNKTLENFVKTQLNIYLIFGRSLDCDTLILGSLFCKKIGWDTATESLEQIYPTIPCFFQSTATLNKLGKTDFCLLFGINPRTEASLVNLRVNKQTNTGRITTCCVGLPSDLQYKVKNLGLHTTHLLNLVWGEHTLSRFIHKNPILIYGDTLTKRKDAQSSLILAYISQITLSKNESLNTLRLPLGSNSIGSAFLGVTYPTTFLTFGIKYAQTNYFLGIQDPHLVERTQNTSKFIYENSHYKDIKSRPDFLLPIQSTYEKTGKYINYNGNLQKTLGFLRFAQKPLTFIKNFKNIKSSLKIANNKKFLFSSKSSLDLQKLGLVSPKLKCFTTPLQTILGDIYQTDPGTSASLTLSKISGIIRQAYWSFKY
jgi:NADH dehydrogenase (ubiquinone) Fe-S protein 1